MSRAREGHPAWRRIVAVYIAVQFAEIFGVSMIYSYLPLALEGTGVPIGESLGSLSLVRRKYQSGSQSLSSALVDSSSSAAG
jgi:hypothetical protein